MAPKLGWNDTAWKAQCLFTYTRLHKDFTTYSRIQMFTQKVSNVLCTSKLVSLTLTDLLAVKQAKWLCQRQKGLRGLRAGTTSLHTFRWALKIVNTSLHFTSFYISCTLSCPPPSSHFACWWLFRRGCCIEIVSLA